MSSGAGWLVFAGLVAVCGGVMVVFLREEHDDEVAADPPRVLVWTHDAPARPFTAAQAHRVMQAHRTCRRQECPRKRAAYRTLVRAGRLHPDSGRVR